jgi:plastocyanin
MKRIVVVAALGCAATLSVVLPAAASARTHLVWAGGTPSFQKTMQNKLSAEANDFFPHSVTVNQGDTVEWQGMSIGFHSIDVPKKGGPDLPLILPTGTTASGLNDFSGNPFWFNGQPNLGFNPQLFSASGPKVYNGSARADSGLPLGPKATPFKLKFTKPGTYVYFCDVHYDMRGIIVVRPRGKATLTPALETAAIAAQQKRDLKIAKKLDKTKITGNRVSLGVGGKDDVEVLAMFPRTLRVHSGATVSFAMATPTGETHTATFGPNSYLKPLEDSFGGPTPSATAVYPSSPPGTTLAVPGPHGNGFANSGALDRDGATPLPPGAKFAFTAPGTYQFVCLIHPFMRGTVVVSP